MSSFNSNPIVITTNMASGWRSLQTLNVGNLPATVQTPNPPTRQWGIQVQELVWTGVVPGASVLVVDPIDNTVLASYDVPAGYTGGDIDVTPMRRTWRDFKVTLTGGTLYIWYRA